MVVLLLIIGCAAWVYADAKSIGVRKGLVTGLGDMSPLGWLIATLGIWIVAFPAYLYYRGEFKRALANPEILGSEKSLGGPTKLSGWAIAAFYAGLLAILIVPAPIAIFSGIMAMRDIDRDATKSGKGRAIFGIIAGAIVTALFIAGMLSARSHGHG
jgi:hypothetical protein